MLSLWRSRLASGQLIFDTRKVCQLTGEIDLERPDRLTGQVIGENIGQRIGRVAGTVEPEAVTGTDLDFPFEHLGRLYLLFGDIRELDPDLWEPSLCAILST